MLTISVGPEAGGVMSYIILNLLSPIIISAILYFVSKKVMLYVIKDWEARRIVNVVLKVLAVILIFIMYGVR